MSRALKFRAWDKKTNKMYPVESLAWDLSGNLDEVWLVGVEPDYDDEESYTNFRTPDEVILEQSTGLTDENGKEIWAGDIIRYCGLEEFYAVEMRQGRWMIGRDELFFYNNDCEVIGNIHGNPEMLGDTNVTNKEEK